MFTNRTDAGRQLARALGHLHGREAVVLALPRGGVPVAAEIAAALHAPLDLVLVRKIGVPGRPELAAGAVVDGDRSEIVLNEEILAAAGVSHAYVERCAALELKEIERRRRLYLSGRPRVSVAGRTAIVVDDGIATGATIRAALRSVRRHRPAHLVLAVPVAPPDTVAEIRAEVDELVCLSTPYPFGAIGAFYRDFHQVGDDEVRALLDRGTTDERPTSPRGT